MIKTIQVLSSVLLIFCINLSSQAQQWDGLTLYSNGNSTTAQLVDTNNVVVKTWSGLSGGTGYSSYLEPGGTLVRSVRVMNSVFMGGGACGRIQKVDFNGNLIWDFTYSSSTYYSHHDHCVLPNGNVLLIAYEVKTGAELAAAGGTLGLASIWPDKIVEIQPTGLNTGTIVWEWHVWDHLVQNVDPSKANYQTSIVDNPELLNINYLTAKDWLHSNGLDYNPVLDQIALSSHFMNEWYIIDHSTTTAEAASHSGGKAGKGGDFLYRWGNPQAYQASGTKILNTTHDVHWIPEGHPNAWHMVGFNNQGVSNNVSSVDEISLPRQDLNYTITPGSAFTPASYLSRLSGFGYSSNEGSSEQYPNGNQLVCVALSGKIYEVNPAGVPIFTITTGAQTAQAHRYSTCYVNNTAPAQPSITQNANILQSSPAASYQWYLNGNMINGATSQTYAPTGSGLYVVRIGDANGCLFAYSTMFSYTLLDTSLPEQNLGQVSLKPNPSQGIVELDFASGLAGSLQISVYDALGKQVKQFFNQTQLDLSDLSNGVYTIGISSERSWPVYTKIILQH